jgi:hypothetical protein
MDENEAWQWSWRADRLAEIERLQRRRAIGDITAELSIVAWSK